jgi:hypothetical protein
MIRLEFKDKDVTLHRKNVWFGLMVENCPFTFVCQLPWHVRTTYACVAGSLVYGSQIG